MDFDFKNRSPDCIGTAYLFVVFQHEYARYVYGIDLNVYIYESSLVTWLLYGFFKDVPGEIEESALVDGCNRFTAFFRVIFPIIGPGLVSAGLLSFIFAWNEFLFANILSGPNVRTAPVGLNEYATPVSVLWGQIAAAGTMIIVPIAIITLVLQRKMVSGLTMGAVKG